MRGWGAEARQRKAQAPRSARRELATSTKEALFASEGGVEVREGLGRWSWIRIRTQGKPHVLIFY
jgi:hypothetical protein